MGTLLVNERMLETYIYARKHHLVPGGKLFPTNGTIYLGGLLRYRPLWNDGLQQVGVLDATTTFTASTWVRSTEEAENVVICAAPSSTRSPPHVLVSNSVVQTFDFQTLDESDLLDFEIKLSPAGLPAVHHAWHCGLVRRRLCGDKLHTHPCLLVQATP